MIISGAGGQGVILAGDIIGEAAVKCGYNVSVLPAYGPEMRGGTAHSIVIISNKDIYSPIPDTFDVLISLNLPSLERFSDKIEPNGIIIHNRSLGTANKKFEKHKYFELPLSQTANDIGSIKVLNILAIGALHSVLEVIEKESFEEVLKEKFQDSKKNLLDLNLQAFHVGRNFF